MNHKTRDGREKDATQHRLRTGGQPQKSREPQQTGNLTGRSWFLAFQQWEPAFGVRRARVSIPALGIYLAHEPQRPQL